MKQHLKRRLPLTLSMVLNTRRNFIAEPESIERQSTDVRNPILRRQPPNNLPKKLCRFPDGNVVVIDFPIQPGDEPFYGPVILPAEVKHLLVQRSDKIGIACIAQQRRLDVALLSDIDHPNLPIRTSQRVIRRRQRRIFLAQLPGVVEQKGAFELVQHAVLGKAEQRHKKVQLLLIRRRLSRLSASAEGLLRLTDHLRGFREPGFGVRSRDTALHLFQVLAVERHDDGDGAAGGIDPHLSAKRGLLDLDDGGIDLVRTNGHSLRLHTERQRALRHGKNDPFGLCLRKPIVFQRLAQLRQYRCNRIRDREGIGAIQIRMLLRLGVRQPEDAPDNLLNRRGRPGFFQAAEHIGKGAIPPLAQFLHRDDHPNRALRRGDILHPFEFIEPADGDLHLVV